MLMLVLIWPHANASWLTHGDVESCISDKLFASSIHAEAAQRVTCDG
jgi:hypothetical protein